MYLVSWLHVFPVYMYMWYMWITDMYRYMYIYNSTIQIIHGWKSFSFPPEKKSCYFLEIVAYITHTHTSLDGWGDYKQDKCFSCGCNVTAGSANTWLDAVRSCIRMCDHIPGRSPRLSAVTLDKTLSNHVLTAYLLVTGVHVFKCTNWIFVMAWLLLVV